MSIVNSIKNLLSTRLVLLCCLVGTAGPGLADNRVYMEDFSIQAGETKTVAVSLATDVELRSVKGTIVMPEGLEVQNLSSKAGEYSWIEVDANRLSSAVASYNPQNGKVSINGFGATIAAGNGTLAYITVKATEALADGSRVTLSGFTATDTGKNTVTLATADATVTTGQTPQLSFSPAELSLRPGATGQVEVQLDNTMALTGLQATIAISEGLQLGGVPVKGARLNGNIVANPETMSVMFVGTIAAGSGTVMTIPVKASEGFTGGTVKLTGIAVTTQSAKGYYPQDIELAVTVDDGAVDVDGDNVTVDETKGTPKAGIIADGQTAAKLEYTRTAGGLFTVCLPYVPPVAEGLKYYELTGAEGTVLTFDEVAEPKAGTPYLAVAESAVAVGGKATGVTLAREAGGKSAGGYALKGTMTGLSNAEAEAAGAYILQEGGVWQRVSSANKDAYIPPFRAYIVATGGASRLSTVLGDATGISSLRTVGLDGTENWYDLGGRRIAAPATKGLYIVNGKKIIK